MKKLASLKQGHIPMSIEDKAKKLTEKVKLAAGSAAAKAKVTAGDASQKMKDIDVEKLKGDITDDDGKLSINSIKALNNKTKMIISGVLFLILILLISGGKRSYSISNLSELYPSNGTIEARCDKTVFLQYDFKNLLNDGADIGEMIAELDIALNTVDKNTFAAMPKMEQTYYKGLHELKGVLVRGKGKLDRSFKESHLTMARYERAFDKCVARNGNSK